MIETDEQRRWWFATHPEYSWSRRKGKSRENQEKEADDHKVSPEAVDAYVDKALTQLTGPVADFLKAIKRWFGTEENTQKETEGSKAARFTYDQGIRDGMQWALDPKRGPGPPLVLNPNYMTGFSDGVTSVWQWARERSEAWNRVSQAGSKTWDTVTDWLPLVEGTRWKVGDDHLAPTSKGNDPVWETQKARYWKNEAAKDGAAEKWGAENAERMKRGLAPQRPNPTTGKIESVEMESRELHHHPKPQREGGKEFIEVWPDEHAAIDPYRRLKKP